MHFKNIFNRLYSAIKILVAFPNSEEVVAVPALCQNLWEIGVPFGKVLALDCLEVVLNRAEAYVGLEVAHVLEVADLDLGALFVAEGNPEVLQCVLPKVIH